MRQSSRQASNAVPPPATEPFTAGPAPGAPAAVASPVLQQQPQGVGPYGAMGNMGSISMAPYGGAYGRPTTSTVPSPPSSAQYRGRSYDEHERR